MRVIIAIGIAGLLLFNAATPAAAGDLDADKQVIRDYIDKCHQQKAAGDRRALFRRRLHRT